MQKKKRNAPLNANYEFIDLNKELQNCGITRLTEIGGNLRRRFFRRRTL